MSYICDICELKISNIKNLTKHKNTEKCQYIKRILDKREKLYLDKINIIEEKNYKINEEYENLIIKLNNKIEEQNKEIQLLKEKSEEYRIIIEKIATRTTKTTVKNYTHNNYLNYISTEPLKISEISKQLKQIVNCDTIMYNDEEFHDHIVDNILKDREGKDKVLCTDINRKNFTYKDETSGELISDPELERLRDKLKKGTDIRLIRRELLEKLVNEYEENGNIGIDPYKQFSEIIQKLNFGYPFVEHVAKKTYVKRCPTFKTESNLEYKKILTNEEYKEYLE